jgi:uncharacterized protein (DUF1697 family)
MELYICFLRGINVSGQKSIKMEALREMFESLKFKNVCSYIQSGNILFESPETNIEKLQAKISKEIGTTFGFDVPVCILTAKEIQAIIKKNPFGDKDPTKLHVTVLSKAPAKDEETALAEINAGKDELKILGKNVYLFCPEGYGNTKLNNAVIEKKLKCSATTRNWKTLNEMMRLSTEK